MKILVEINLPEEGFKAFREKAPPPEHWTEEQVRHAIIRALMMGILHDMAHGGFEFDVEAPGVMFGGNYCVRRLAS